MNNVLLKSIVRITARKISYYFFYYGVNYVIYLILFST